MSNVPTPSHRLPLRVDLLAISGFVLSAYLIIQSFQLFQTSPQLFEQCVIAGGLILSLWTFLATSLGHGVVGVGLLMGGSLVILLMAASSHRPIFYSQIPLLVMVGAIGMVWHRRMALLEKSVLLRADQMQGEINVIHEELRRQLTEQEILKKRITKYTALKEISEELGTFLNVEGIAQFVVEKLFQLIGKSQATLMYLVDPREQEIHLVASHYASPLIRAKAKKGDGFDQWVFRQSQPLLVHDAERDFRFHQPMPDEEPRVVQSLIECPIVSQQKVLGILRLDSDRPETYHQDDLRFLQIIADLTAVVLETAFLYQRTEELAIRDGLTNLYLHRYFEERLTEELHRAASTQAHLSLAIVDIDNFKDYNDRYGHTAGDILLKKISEVLLREAKPASCIARYGGDEFAVILPMMSQEEASTLVEGIRQAVAQEPFVLRREQTHCTVSIGLASSPEDTMVKEELIRIADHRLYQAKREGRNRICAKV